MTNKVLAIIPARGGSKGLPGKNIRNLSGKPLIGWTIEAALKANSIDDVVVSTDCEQIAEISSKEGANVPFLRPKEISTDNSSAAEVVKHALDNLNEEFHTIVLLQPTSPLRDCRHIDEAFSLYIKSGASSIVSVCTADKSPYWMFWRSETGTLLPVMDKLDGARRQILEKAYVLNGAIYILSVEKFLSEMKFVYHDTLSYVMDKRSSVDIDDIIDFNLAQLNLGGQ